jgi:predicted ester cyclase
MNLPEAQSAPNPKTGMTHDELKRFIRNHFEDFVNRQRPDVADLNFAPDFVDHGDDLPPGLAPGPEGAKQYIESAYKRFPDIHVSIEDMIAEDDKVVVRNRWTATESASGHRVEFSGIVIWRVAARQIHERWAYLQKPHPSTPE